MVFRRESGVIEETPDEARQGRRGVPVFYVLIVSTVLAAVVLFAAYLSWSVPPSEAELRGEDAGAASATEAAETP